GRRVHGVAPTKPAKERSVSGRILVVEDDVHIRESLRDVLEDEGYEVTTARNGKEGLEQLAEMNHPCVVLLDLMMPVMNGGEFLKAVRADDIIASIPVIVVSAWPKEAARVADQAQSFVKKPVALEVLLEEIERFCKR